MFFRRKRKADERAGAVAPAAPQASSPSRGETSVDGGTSRFLTGENLVDQKTVRVLLDAIARVNESRDLEELLVYIVDTSIEVTGAERGFLVFERPDGKLWVRVARQRGAQPLREEPRFSTSVVHRVLHERSPLRSIDSTAEAMQLGTSVFDLKLRAMMCVPLGTSAVDGEAMRGALYVDSKVATREFKDEDLALFEALSQHISVALVNARLHVDSLEKARLERSLEIASEIQEGLMPQIPPARDGWEVHGWYRSAERTSGDFYDFVRTKDGRLALVVGDVTGHGIGPALVTATAQASLRSYLRVIGDLGQAVTMLNQDLGERMDAGMFLTLFVAIVAPDGRLDALNAGHSPPLVWRAADGAIETIGGGGPALGMMEEFTYGEHFATTLARGDVLVAVTDGISEARAADAPEDFFGEARLREAIATAAVGTSSARAVAEGIVARVLEFSRGNSEDDLTVVVLRRSE